MFVEEGFAEEGFVEEGFVEEGFVEEGFVDYKTSKKRVKSINTQTIYVFKIYKCVFSENKSLLLQILVMAQQKPSKINPRRLKMKVRGSPSKINI